MTRDELLVFGRSLWMFGDIPLVSLTQVARPVFEQRQINNGHRDRSARQVGERRARDQRPEMRVPVFPVDDAGICSFALERRGLVRLGGAAVRIAEDIEVGAV